MLMVKLFDVQEESLDSTDLLPLSRFKSCYRFLYFIATLKEKKQNLIKERSQTHASISQRFVTINSLSIDKVL